VALPTLRFTRRAVQLQRAWERAGACFRELQREQERAGAEAEAELMLSTCQLRPFRPTLNRRSRSVARAGHVTRCDTSSEGRAPKGENPSPLSLSPSLSLSPRNLRVEEWFERHPALEFDCAGSWAGTFNTDTMSSTRRDLFDNIAPVYDQVRAVGKAVRPGASFFVCIASQTQGRRGTVE
jgi:hypothetical protein